MQSRIQWFCFLEQFQATRQAPLNRFVKVLMKNSLFIFRSHLTYILESPSIPYFRLYYNLILLHCFPNPLPGLFGNDQPQKLRKNRFARYSECLNIYIPLRQWSSGLIWERIGQAHPAQGPHHSKDGNHYACQRNQFEFSPMKAHGNTQVRMVQNQVIYPGRYWEDQAHPSTMLV